MMNNSKGTPAGGFLLFFVPPEKRASVRHALPRLINVPLQFEFEGSKTVFYDPEQDYGAIAEERQRQEVATFREWRAPAA